MKFKEMRQLLPVLFSDQLEQRIQEFEMRDHSVLPSNFRRQQNRFEVYDYFRSRTFIQLKEALALGTNEIFLTNNRSIELDIPFDDAFLELQEGRGQIYSSDPFGNPISREVQLEQTNGNIGEHVCLREYTRSPSTCPELQISEYLCGLPMGTFLSHVIDGGYGTSLSAQAQTRVTQFLEKAVHTNRKILIHTADVGPEKKQTYVYSGFEP